MYCNLIINLFCEHCNDRLDILIEVINKLNTEGLWAAYAYSNEALVLNENIDGAAFNNFCTKNMDGIIGGVLEECPMYLSSSNIISIGSGLLIIKGFRVKILEDGLHFSVPSGTTPGVIKIICSLTLNRDRSVLTEISLSEEMALKQDNILIEEEGKYEVEIGRFYWDGSSAKNLTRSISVIPVENIELAQTLEGKEEDKAPSVKAVKAEFAKKQDNIGLVVSNNEICMIIQEDE